MGPSGRAYPPLSLLIEIDSDPIAGFIIQQGRLELPFYGWLELLVALDAIHRGDLTEAATEIAEHE